MESATPNQQSNKAPSVMNPDGSDKNFGGFDENGKLFNKTTEKFPGNESHPGNKPNYPELHKAASSGNEYEADSKKGGEVGSGSSDSSQNIAENNDGEDETPRGDNPLNERFSSNRGHKPPGDESIANRGPSNGNKDKQGK